MVQQLKGVDEVISGYSGGNIRNPTYKEVSSGLTGHAEVVKVKFDPGVIPYEELMQIFMDIHNPYVLYKSESKYSQYRSIILYHNEDQKQKAEGMIEEMQQKTEQQIFTELVPFVVFYKAEEHHQDYFLKDPEKGYCQNIIKPKIDKLKKKKGNMVLEIIKNTLNKV